MGKLWQPAGQASTRPVSGRAHVCHRRPKTQPSSQYAVLGRTPRRWRRSSRAMQANEKRQHASWPGRCLFCLARVVPCLSDLASLCAATIQRRGDATPKSRGRVIRPNDLSPRIALVPLKLIVLPLPVRLLTRVVATSLHCRTNARARARACRFVHACITETIQKQAAETARG